MEINLNVENQENKIKEYFDEWDSRSDWHGHDGHDARLATDVVIETLNILGIKIEGVNL